MAKKLALSLVTSLTGLLGRKSTCLNYRDETPSSHHDCTASIGSFGSTVHASADA